MSFITEARDHAVVWARNTLANPNVVILDTETTGLSSIDQVIQIAILGIDGSEILDKMIKPTVSISEAAFAVHGIGMDQLEDKPDFGDVVPRFVEATRNKTVVIYNAVFDWRMIRQSCESLPYLAEMQEGGFFTFDDYPVTECAMLKYAEYCGEWNANRQSFRWKPLTGGDHSAMGDCRAVLELIQKMAAARLLTEEELQEANHE